MLDTHVWHIRALTLHTHTHTYWCSFAIHIHCYNMQFALISLYFLAKIAYFRSHFYTFSLLGFHNITRTAFVLCILRSMLQLFVQAVLSRPFLALAFYCIFVTVASWSVSYFVHSNGGWDRGSFQEQQFSMQKLDWTVLFFPCDLSIMIRPQTNHSFIVAGICCLVTSRNKIRDPRYAIHKNNFRPLVVHCALQSLRRCHTFLSVFYS